MFEDASRVSVTSNNKERLVMTVEVKENAFKYLNSIDLIVN